MNDSDRSLTNPQQSHTVTLATSKSYQTAQNFCLCLRFQAIVSPFFSETRRWPAQRLWIYWVQSSALVTSIRIQTWRGTPRVYTTCQKKWNENDRSEETRRKSQVNPEILAVKSEIRFILSIPFFINGQVAQENSFCQGKVNSSGPLSSIGHASQPLCSWLGDRYLDPLSPKRPS